MQSGLTNSVDLHVPFQHERHATLLLCEGHQQLRVRVHPATQCAAMSTDSTLKTGPSEIAPCQSVVNGAIGVERLHVLRQRRKGSGRRVAPASLGVNLCEREGLNEWTAGSNKGAQCGSSRQQGERLRRTQRQTSAVSSTLHSSLDI